MTSIRIALDAMGGDHAPLATVQGAVDALREAPGQVSLLLTGREKQLREILSQCGGGDLPIEIIDTDEVVDMHDSPSKVFKTKPNSSMNWVVRLQKEGKADASLSAGNTGALLVASTLIQGRLEGIQRPAIAIVIPGLQGPCVLLDAGANVDCKAQHLVEFALMGAAYAHAVLEIANPRVGLLSNGEESSKGNELVLTTYPLLEKSGLNFIGNLEGHKTLLGGADVMVCDGFVGNVVLKLAESLAYLLKGKSDRASQFDYTQYGGAPFLGVNGFCVKAHGGSNAKAIKNAILTTAKMVRQNVNREIGEYVKKVGVCSKPESPESV